MSAFQISKMSHELEKLDKTLKKYKYGFTKLHLVNLSLILWVKKFIKTFPREPQEHSEAGEEDEGGELAVGFPSVEHGKTGFFLLWSLRELQRVDCAQIGHDWGGLHPAGSMLLRLQWTNSHGLQKSCGEKGTAWPLSEWESTLTLAWTGFYCFSGSIT